jgi:hypothetical protein
MARTAKYTESVSAMVEADHKAFLLGSAEVEGVSEGDVLRSLLDAAMEQLLATGQLDLGSIEARIDAGRAQLAARRKGGG